MDKTAIKNFAIQARKDLIAGVKQKAYEYGIDEKTTGNEAPTNALLNGRILTPEEQSQRNELLNLIKTKGYDQVMEEVAYTWFNRFIALRFMEVNEYLPSRIRVFTNEKNEFQPEILSEAIHLDLESLDKTKVISLLETNQTEKLYKYLLITQCNDLNSALPEMFEKIQNYTELLFPNNLLKEGSVLYNMVFGIPQDDWKEAVEIIGWLYQYYNTEVKDETFALLSKNIKITKERIPAATQLFTPDWIVRYMVENSLGRLWVEGHPTEVLKSNWKYYMNEAVQESEVDAQLEKIRADYAKIKPEEIMVIDPCMGSGHILVYAFDVLMQIYIASGYSERDAAKSILQNNLFGLDIDDRAYQLSYFAVMMKARKYCSTVFSAGIRPNLYSIQESKFATPELIDYVADGNVSIKYDLQVIVDTLQDAKEFGSILNIPKVNYGEILLRVNETQKYEEHDLLRLSFQRIMTNFLGPLIRQAQVMSQKYDVVVTNPPYMGSSGMGTKLQNFVSINYPDSKSDLFAVFIEKGMTLAKINGFNCMVTMQSWMFLSSFEKLRKKLLSSKTISNLLHMENMVMGIAFGTAVTNIYNQKITQFKGTYNQIKLPDIENDSPKAFPIVENRFAQVDTEHFYKIPGLPIAYWVSETMSGIFEKHAALDSICELRQGMATTNNSLFLRFWYETNINNIGFEMRSEDESAESGFKWFPYNKGGEFRKWYGNNDYIVNFKNHGKEVCDYIDEYSNSRVNHKGRVINREYYFKESITWSLTNANSFGARKRSAGSIFDINGMSLFTLSSNLNYLLGYLCSKPASAFMKINNPTLASQVGDVARLPIILDSKYKNQVSSIVEGNIQIARKDWDSYETSWDFIRHPLVISHDCKLIADSFDNWKCFIETQYTQLKYNEEELNRIFIEIFGLQNELTPEIEDKDITIHKADLRQDIRSFLSYVIGVILGRYSLDTNGLVYAGGDWDDSKYLTILPDKDNILPISDDVYFEDDIVSKVVDFVKIVYGEETIEDNLQFIADSLSNRGNTSRDVIRNYFLNDFYKDHLKIYQKRPIYWLFDSGKKNGFKALMYMHRYKPDLLATMRTDYVHEQQERYRTQLQHLEASLMHASPADQAKINKQIGKLKEQSLELLAYEEKIHHLADQMIDIDLDDGVKVNYAKFQDVLAPIK